MLFADNTKANLLHKPMVIHDSNVGSPCFGEPTKVVSERILPKSKMFEKKFSEDN